MESMAIERLVASPRLDPLRLWKSLVVADHALLGGQLLEVLCSVAGDLAWGPRGGLIATAPATSPTPAAPTMIQGASRRFLCGSRQHAGNARSRARSNAQVGPVADATAPPHRSPYAFSHRRRARRFLSPHGPLYRVRLRELVLQWHRDQTLAIPPCPRQKVPLTMEY